MTIGAKYTVRIPAVKPGDFGPSAYAVWADGYGSSSVVKDGDVVEAIGDIRYETEGSYDDMYEIEYRKVRLGDGFEGTVCWHYFDGRSGFERLIG